MSSSPEGAKGLSQGESRTPSPRSESDRSERTEDTSEESNSTQGRVARARSRIEEENKRVRQERKQQVRKKTNRQAGLVPEFRGLDQAGRVGIRSWPSKGSQAGRTFCGFARVTTERIEESGRERTGGELSNMSSNQAQAQRLAGEIRTLGQELAKLIADVVVQMTEGKQSFMIVGHRTKISMRYSLLLSKLAEVKELQAGEDVSVDMTECFKVESVMLEDVKVAMDSMNHYIKAKDGTLERPQGNTIKREDIQLPKLDKLSLPDFFGDSLELETFKKTFTQMMNTCGYSMESKTMHLRLHIKGAAKEFIGKEGLKYLTYDEIWARLDQKYGQKWLQTRDAVRQLFDLQAPGNDMKEIESYVNKRRDALKALLRLKINLEEAVTNDTLNNIPKEVRAQIDEKLRPDHPDFKMSFDTFSDKVDIVLSSRHEVTRKPEKVGQYYAGFQPGSSQGEHDVHKTHQERPGGQQWNKSKKRFNQYKPTHYKHFNCYLCGGDTHPPWYCTKYPWGPAVRERLSQLNRCRGCVVKEEAHGENCKKTDNMRCKYHKAEPHFGWTCNGGTHPGWQGKQSK